AGDVGTAAATNPSVRRDPTPQEACVSTYLLRPISGSSHPGTTPYCTTAQRDHNRAARSHLVPDDLGAVKLFLHSPHMRQSAQRAVRHAWHRASAGGMRSPE